MISYQLTVKIVKSHRAFCTGIFVIFGSTINDNTNPNKSGTYMYHRDIISSISVPLLLYVSSVTMQKRTQPVNDGAHVACTNFTIKDDIKVRVAVSGT